MYAAFSTLETFSPHLLFISTISFVIIAYRMVKSANLVVIARYGVLAASSLAIIMGSGGLYAYFHRPMPQATQETLFNGVQYIRDVRIDPRPLVIHVLTVDLNTPGLQFLATPYTPTDDKVLAARTTSQFLDEYDLQIAINADSFGPWYKTSLFDHYPHAGDPINPRGFTASQGQVYTEGYEDEAVTAFFSADNQVDFVSTDAPVYNAVSGYDMIVQGGINVTGDLPNRQDVYNQLHPRTVYGLNASEDTLILMVVDGRQPNYSEGATVSEMADLMIEHGAYSVLLMDGGGSSTLVIEDTNGHPQVLNSPIDNVIVGQERPIGTHLGIYVPR